MKQQVRANIFILLVLFLLAIILGYVIGSSMPGSSNFSLTNFKGVHSIWLLEILIRNTIVFVILTSTILFGNIVSILFFIINGFNIGLVCGHISLFQALILLVPHGLIEFTAYFLLVYAILKKDNLRANILRSYCVLCLAALIEVFITPYLALWLLGG